MFDVADLLRGVLASLHPDVLFPELIHAEDHGFVVRDERIDLRAFAGLALLGIGKAAGPQIEALTRILQPTGVPLLRPFVVTRPGHASAGGDYESVEGSHPYPDAASLAAADALEARVASIPADHLLITALSGGGSALVESPRAPFTFDDIVRANRALVDGGASIVDTNLVRRELSRIKNGGLLRTVGAGAVLTLVTSDVPTPDLAVVASGPTLPVDLDAEAVRAAAGRWLPPDLAEKIDAELESTARREWIAACIEAGRRTGARAISVGDHALLIRRATTALVERGFAMLRVVDDPFDVDVQTGIDAHVSLLDELATAEPPWAIVTAGEMPVRVTGDGRGGRNTEFVARLARAVFHERRSQLGEDALDQLVIASVGTDGSDGPTANAGGFLCRADVDDAELLDDAIERNDSLGYLEPRGRALVTGPTATNLMDLRLIVRAN